MSEAEQGSFIRIAKTPVAITESLKLTGFIMGDLAGRGPGNKEALWNPFVQVSYKLLQPRSREDLHRHGQANREFVFVLNHPWGPIHINGMDQGVVESGEFTAIAGDRVFLDWTQEGDLASKALVIKEPSVNDKTSAKQEDLLLADDSFLKDNFVEIARNNNGVIASPETVDSRLKTANTEITYWQGDFPFTPTVNDDRRRVLLVVVGGYLGCEINGATKRLSPSKTLTLDPTSALIMQKADDRTKLFIVKTPLP